MEIEICAQAASMHGCVIACGGGIIKNEINIERLKQNGLIVYIQRDVQKLSVDESRPLSTSRERLIEMEKERHPLYLEASDIQVINNDTIENCLIEIKEKVYEN